MRTRAATSSRVGVFTRRSQLARFVVFVMSGGLAACADKAPASMWPDAPPPVMAKPIEADPETNTAVQGSSPADKQAEPAAAETNGPEDGAVRLDEGSD